ncbi:MAG: YkvA family protein [Treponemataceae bacterium]
MNKKKLQNALSKAEELGKNASDEDIKNIKKNMLKMNKGPLAKIWDKVQQLWAAFCASETPSNIKIIIIGGLLYMIMPLDLIPDIIPGVGLLDDAGVLLMIFSKLIALGVIADAAAEAVNKTISYITQKHREDFRKNLWKEFKQTIKITAINLAIILTGFLLLFISQKITTIPFALFYYSVLLLFLVSFIWGVIRLVKTIKKFYKPVFSIIKKRSLRDGLAEYFKKEQPWINLVEKGVKTTKKILPVFEKIPELEQIIDDYIQFLKKDIRIMIISFTLYYLMLNLFLRLFVAEQLSTLPVISLYLFPFLHFFSWI